MVVPYSKSCINYLFAKHIIPKLNWFQKIIIAPGFLEEVSESLSATLFSRTWVISEFHWNCWCFPHLLEGLGRFACYLELIWALSECTSEHTSHKEILESQNKWGTVKRQAKLRLHGRKEISSPWFVFPAGRGSETSTQQTESSLLRRPTFPFPRDTSNQGVINNRRTMLV